MAPRIARGSRRKRALVLSMGVTSLLILLALVVTTLPLAEADKERLIAAILWPLLAFTQVLTWVIDYLGPRGQPERASLYLRDWEIWSGILVSVGVFVFAVYAIALGVLSRVGGEKVSFSSGKDDRT